MEDHGGHRMNRFKHQSYNQTLKDVHLPSALSQSTFDHDLADDESHFYQALEHWRQLNLAPAFLHFAQRANLLSASMPLLLHNWREIVELWVGALESSDDEGLRALLDLLQKMAHDLRTTLSPVYLDLLNRLLQLLPRSISAPALTALLETFSALFKYLLLPSVNLEPLERTWLSICGILPKCLPEVQRAMAEVWGSVLRRLKMSSRDKAVILLADNVKGIEDACAWSLVFACKSVSQSLHTSTTSIMSPVVTSYMTCEEPAALYTLIRRVLTALIHHVKQAEQFSSLSDMLLTHFLAVAKSHSSDDSLEQLRRMLEIITVPAAVRQGSRLSQKQLSELASEFISLPMTQSLYPTLLKFAAAVLVAGDIALWMGPGRKVIERSWQFSEFGIKLSGVLAELGWGGWNMIALPSVLKKMPQLLESEPIRAVGLLAALYREKNLGQLDVLYQQKLETLIYAQLRRWEKTDESVLELSDILELSPLFLSLSPLLIQIVETTLQSHPEKDCHGTSANPSWIIGACMQSLAKYSPDAWTSHVDLLLWTRKAVEGWSWSEHVLKGLVALVQASSSENEVASLDSLYPALRQSLLSQSRRLRLGCLRLLACRLVKSSANELEVVKGCLQGEEVSLDVQGVRGRLLRIGSVGQAVRDGDEISADLCARWLIAQFKINLRPIWSPAAEALASLSQRFGSLVWSLLFSELQAISVTQPTEVAPHSVGNKEEAGSIEDPWEAERSWRDPSAHKVRCTVLGWLRDDKWKTFLVDRDPDDRLDHQSYEFQLLSCLEKCSALAEKHNRVLIPYFLSLAGPDASSKMSRPMLRAWLSLFAKFSNPKALYSTDNLRTIYISLLSHPDRSIQTLSLSCLLTYKSPYLSPHEARLQALLDDSRRRDELVSFNLREIELSDRSELVDVVIRLLFGLMLEKRGRSRGGSRRAAILEALAGCHDQELGLLVDLMLGPFNSNRTARQEEVFQLLAMPDWSSEKQQIGFLTLLGDVLTNIGPQLLSFWPALLGTTLDILGHCQAHIGTATQAGEHEEEAGDPDDVEDVTEAVVSSTKIMRSVRQLGLKRFADFFRCPVSFDFTPFMKESVASFITPRLSSLDKENTQAPSALLELFYSWTLQQEHVKFFVDFDDQILPKIYGCLVATNVKPAVVSRIFDIIDRLLLFSTGDIAILETVVKPHISLLLLNLAVLVERTKGIASISTPLGQRQIAILSQIAQYSTDGAQASTLLGLFSPLLRKPAKVVSEKVKVDLLKILTNLLSLIPALANRTTPVYVKTYDLLSQLFQRLRSRQARLALLVAFQRLTVINTSLLPLSSLLESLNAYSTKRLDEPDFEQRLRAFASLNEDIYRSFSPDDWLPVLYNMLHFIQDPTELAIRNNAAFTFRRFVDLVHDTPSEYEVIFLRILYPAIKKGLRSRNDLVRTEILGVIAYAVKKCDRIGSLQEMRVLLAGGDEEANFFNNIHHVQIHRRSRALHRLADQCDEGHFSNNTLAEIFVPLAANFITTSVDHHLVNEAILTTGRMAKHLAWSTYYALVQKYLKSSCAKDESERVSVRTLIAILDNFHFPMEEAAPHIEKSTLNDDDEEEDDDIIPVTPRTNPVNLGRIVDAVNLRLLPSLLQYLEKHDATTEDSTRIPIAIGIVRLAMHLPTSTREPQISRLLTVLSQILRSHSQDTRDLTRNTLKRIAVTLGPSYLPILLREMRAALLRGPQLHVLAYTTHALLAQVTVGDHAGNLDDCVNDVAHISAEVIFGQSGKDVQSEDFKTKMREVRSSSAKGLDSFAIMAKHITPLKISGLLNPLRAIMHETETTKVMQHVDDVLRRIAHGLNANSHLVPSELLSLCHTLISQNARFLKQAPARRKNNAKGDAIVQMKRQVSAETDHYPNNSFRFVVFGLDLLCTALRRSRFDFRDPAVIARLESMVVVIGNTLYSNSTPVLNLGLKAVAEIVKCPLKSLQTSVPVFVRQIIDMIRQTGSTEPEIVQTAFKSLATILRDDPGTQVKEKDLVYLLELLSPDLEEPLRQASVFTMLRAIVSRKFVVPEIYDIMDKVSEIMITNQSQPVQEQCRGVLLQFLMDYPQGKGRLRNQMAFLAKNLSYVYESGRTSVMELLGAIISKFEVGLITEYSDLLFIALVMVIANDDSSKCREMAAELIKNLFIRLDSGHRNLIISHLHSWATQYSQSQLTRVSSQTYSLIVDVLKVDSLPYISGMLGDLNAALERSSRQLVSAEEIDGMQTDMEWQVPYHSLTAISKVLRVFPNFSTEPDKVNWGPVVDHLLFPHAWVRTASCRLLGLLFTNVHISAPRTDLPDNSPFSRKSMFDITKNLCLQLKSEHLDASHSLQIVKNLFYIGKCFCFMAVPSDLHAEKKLDGNSEEIDDDGKVAEDSLENNPLPWLFSKLSYQIKSAHIARRNRTFSTANWSHQPSSVLRWFAAMTSYMDPEALESFLVHILTPVHRITEDDTIRDSQMDELKILAVELQDLVQSKVGTTKFSNTYNRIRQNVLGIQRERRAARVTKATKNPEAAAKRKIQRNSIKKDSRKRKNQGFVDRKGNMKRRRKE